MYLIISDLLKLSRGDLSNRRPFAPHASNINVSNYCESGYYFKIIQTIFTPSKKKEDPGKDCYVITVSSSVSLNSLNLLNLVVEMRFEPPTLYL